MPDLLQMDLEVQGQSPQNTKDLKQGGGGGGGGGVAPLIHIWWTQLERVTRYCADKLMTDTHTHMDRHTDTQTQAMTIPEG